MVSHGNVRQQDNRISRLAAFVPIKHFGLGSASRGLMKGRIAIPIHNENGELVAYAGLSDAQVVEEWRYLLNEVVPALQGAPGVRSVKAYSRAGALRADLTAFIEMDDAG